ncbi:uncharacterized protein G2W53_007045 [Senna tora]|uniref:Uncharacterized protein n=1 Tax=Senna tora TaxID=362788 RepID=A0A834X5G3_9FABA|nr:uncharacterized protein G2W53_007045 [Senna tora]
MRTRGEKLQSYGHNQSTVWKAPRGLRHNGGTDI